MSLVYAVLMGIDIPDAGDTELKLFPDLKSAEDYLDSLAESKGEPYFAIFDNLGKEEFGIDADAEPVITRDSKYLAVYYESEKCTVGLEAQVHVYDPSSIQQDGSMKVVG